MRGRVIIGLVLAVAIVGGALTQLLRDGSKRHRSRTHPSAPAIAGTAARARTEQLTYRSVAGSTLGITLLSPGRPRALVVLVHGGGFHSGSRRDMNAWARRLAGDDYATATIDYRLAPGQDHNRPRALANAADDTRAALTRLQTDAALRRLPVVLWGYSAGALTVLRVAADNPGSVRAVVSLAGYGQPERIKAGDPPMLLFNGSADRAEPVALATTTCRAARAVSVRCDQVVYPGVTHAITAARGRAIHQRARSWIAGVLGV